MKKTVETRNGQYVKRNMNIRRAMAVALAASMTLSAVGCGSSGEHNKGTSVQEEMNSTQEASSSDAQIESSNASKQEKENAESSNVEDKENSD